MQKPRRRRVFLNGWLVKMGMSVTINDVIVTLTDEFVDKNKKHFYIEELDETP